jgi:hypothetical protein
MPNRQYEAGDRWEKRVMNDLRRRGYICWQTRGSKTAVDIVGLSTRHDDVLLVQAKSGEKITEHAAWNALVDVAVRTDSAPLVADRDGRKIRYRLITGYHQYRSRDWPAEEYQP